MDSRGGAGAASGLNQASKPVGGMSCVPSPVSAVAAWKDRLRPFSRTVYGLCLCINCARSGLGGGGHCILLRNLCKEGLSTAIEYGFQKRLRGCKVGMRTIRLRDDMWRWEVRHSFSRLGSPLFFECGRLLVQEAGIALFNFPLSGSLASSSPSSFSVHTN